MSMKSILDARCPACGETAPFAAWSSIDTATNPELRAAVRDGSAFAFRCPRCGRESEIEHALIYRQPQDSLLVYCIPGGADDGASRAALSRAARTLAGGSGADLVRVVRSHARLREKLAIFDAGLDDRLIELYKIVLLGSLRRERPSVGRPGLVFRTGPGGQPESGGQPELALTLDGRHIGCAALSGEMTELIRERYAGALPGLRQGDPIADERWAAEFMETNGGLKHA